MSAASTLPLFWAAFGLAVVSPGPNFAVILGTAMQSGRRDAVRTALGMVVGEAVWGFGSVFGLALLTLAHPWIATVLRVGGGAFLLWMGVQSLLAASRPAAPAAAPTGVPGRASFRRGIGLMLLNPKAGVFWVSLTGLFIAPDAGLAIGVTAVSGAVMMSLVWHASLAVALSAETVGRVYRRVRRGLDAALGVVLAGIGLRLLIAE